jgi:exodeoxyribonuclease VII small subunit
MSESAFTPVEELSYEAALAELEEIVTRLEGEEHALEEAIRLFERGQALTQYCSEMLEKAELKVQALVEGSLEDFEV